MARPFKTRQSPVLSLKNIRRFAVTVTTVLAVLLRAVRITADRPFGIFNAQQVHLEDCAMVTAAEEDGLDRCHAGINESLR